MTVGEKDPYLSELDSMRDLDDPTKVDIPKPDLSDEKGQSPGKGAVPSKPEPGKPEPGKPDPGKGPVGPEKRPRKVVEEFAPDIPVQVNAVLGSREFTMRELDSLTSGEVVELGCAPNQVIDLVVSGRVIAKGELVEIDGKLGVRVLKVL